MQSPPPDTDLKTNRSIHHALYTIELYLSKHILPKIPVIWKWTVSPRQNTFYLETLLNLNSRNHFLMKKNSCFFVGIISSDILPPFYWFGLVWFTLPQAIMYGLLYYSYYSCNFGQYLLPFYLSLNGRVLSFSLSLRDCNTSPPASVNFATI